MNWSGIAALLAGSAGLLWLVNKIMAFSRRINVAGKVVLITGANSGLGKACAKVFHDAGCRLILTGRNIEQLHQVAKELDSSNKREERVKVLQLELENIDMMPQYCQQALGLYGRVDVLVNNAGISYRGQTEDTDISVDIKVMTINYFGQVALTKALLPSMMDSGGGHIVAISSIQGRIAIPYRSAYSASKHALQAFFDTLRAEVADRNIHVCVVSPGYIRTNLSLNAVCGDGTNYGKVDSTTAKGMLPEKVATLVLDAVRHHRSEVLPAPILHRFVVFLRTAYPTLYFYVMQKRAKAQKKDYTKCT